MTIRAKHPEIFVWKKQTSRFRLAYQKLMKLTRRRSVYCAKRHNDIVRELETDCITPLMPWEKMH